MRRWSFVRLALVGALLAALPDAEAARPRRLRDPIRDQVIEPPRLIEEIEASLQGEEEAEAPPPSAEAPPEEPKQEAAGSGSLLVEVGGNDPFDALRDPLQIGGQLYLRGVVNGVHGTDVKAPCCAPRGLVPEFNAPLLADGYFDARPSERVRGLVRARLQYDPNTATTQNLFRGVRSTGSDFRIILDQFWLRFDLGQVVYVTAGRQHVNWGVGRFWNPTDFLAPSRKDPVAVFDERTGSDLVKLHLPFEALNSNLYLIGIADSGGPREAPLRLGGAIRGELVLGTAELGAEAVFQRGVKPRYGLDLSMGLGPVDLYGEVALRRDTDLKQWRYATRPDLSRGYGGQFEHFRYNEWLPAATGGLLLPLKLSDHLRWSLGAEGFYNHAGYEDSTLIPWLLISEDFQSFYFGKAYAGGFTSLSHERLDSQTYTVTALTNLYDRSWLLRLDASYQIERTITFEAFAEVPLGARGGEFTAQIDLPEEDLSGGFRRPAFYLPPTLFRGGLGVRINL